MSADLRTGTLHMIYSMTAFGRDQSEGDWGTLTWEIRSVNHRYLDISMRLPEDLRGLEAEIRKRLGQRLSRGKVDCGLRFQRNNQAGSEFELDESLVDRLLAAAREIGARSGDKSVLPTANILQWPGVMKTPALDVDALGEAALAGFDRALQELVSTREREGSDLAQHIEQRLAAADAVVNAAREIMPEVISAYRQRVHDRLKDIAQELDPARLEQEIVIFASKSDIAEELDRLVTHISEVRRVIKKGGAVGRRLDFLMQEFNREANTIGSKAADIRVTNASVELKVLIEQMREQVQNVE
jgi:uncharacterized protein (TIGR00255 family)